MYGFVVTKGERQGTVVSQPLTGEDDVFCVIVVWEDDTFTWEPISELKAVSNKPEDGPPGKNVIPLKVH